MQKIINKLNNPKNKVAYGFLLWSFISMGYLLFVANWGFVVGLAGNGIDASGAADAGFLSYFKIVKNAAFDLTNNAANWAITLGRGIGSVAVALLLAKFAHKYSTIIAISLTLIGIPAQFMPAAPYGYVLFLILRTFMAIGGTMLVILTQPVVSAFFGKKQKSIVSQFGIWFYPLGTIISILPFVFAGKSSVVRENWQLIFTILAALNVIPLIIIIIFGSHFDKTTTENQPKQEGFKILGKYLKSKATYAWVLLYGAWLCAVVFPTSVSFNIFHDLAGITRNTFNHEIRIWSVCFLAAVFIAPITIGLWSKTNFKRRWFIGLILFIGIMLYALSAVTFIYGVAKNNKFVSALFYIFGFLSGLCLWGIQGVMLNMPHEYKNSDPKTIGWMFSLIWGMGYIFFTVILIGISIIPIAGAKLGGNNYIYSTITFIVLIVVSLSAILGAFLLKEPSAQTNEQTKMQTK